MTLPTSPFSLYFFWFLWLCLGLSVGSFANVVIWRLPRRLLGMQSETLSKPASHCPACQHPLTWWELLPIFGFLLLRGRCRACHQPIAWRYPLVEILSASVFAYCAWRFGFTWPTLAWSCVWVAFLTLALIDWDFFLLPDTLTLPLLLLGLVFAAAGWNFAITWQEAALGAGCAYVVLWAVGRGFYLLRGQQALGAGDPKLLAALAAWTGLASLWSILFWASVLGILHFFAQQSTIRIFSRSILPRPTANDPRAKEWFATIAEQSLPFGFFLVLAAALTWFGFLPSLQAIMALLR